jgi:hypothetical protein
MGPPRRNSIAVELLIRKKENDMTIDRPMLRYSVFVFLAATAVLLFSQSAWAQWTPNGNDVYKNPTTGNVGIGTTTPSDALHIVKDNGGLRLDTATSGTVIPIVTFATTGTNRASIQYRPDLPGLAIQTGGSSYPAQNTMAITDGGNVGIGTTNPGTRLDVSASGFIQYITLSNATSYGAISFRETGGNSKGHIGMTGSGSGTTYVGGASAFQIWNGQNAPIVFGTNGSERVRIDSRGYVGIGKPDPQVPLDVVGSINVSGNINAKYQDVAEWVPSSEQLAAGTVVVLDQTKSNQVIASTQPYDTRVAGVISAQPGITLGEKSDNKVLVATTGRVRVKVDASRGPIAIGDLLVTSDVPGLAMRSEAVNLGGVQIHRPGTIIGKALEPLAKGKGEILVLLSLQ